MRRTIAPKTQPSIIASLLLLSSSSGEKKKLLTPNLLFLDLERLWPVLLDRESLLVTSPGLTAAFSGLILKNIVYLTRKPGDNWASSNTLKLN